MRLKGRVAVVTGASGAIGREICRTFALEGALVECLDRDANAVASLAASDGMQGRASAHALDLTSRAAVDRTIGEIDARHAGIDVLVNSVGWVRFDPLAEISDEIVNHMLAVNVKAPLWCIQACAPAMRKRGGGSVINLSSVAAIRGEAGRLVYCSVKGALNAMTMQCAVELGASGIRVNAIAPGAVLHNGNAARLGVAGIQRRIDQTPLGRLPSATDVASLALFYASDESGMVSGQVTVIDGARSLIS